MEISTGRFLERHDINSVDPDVAEIGHGRMVGEDLGEAGRGERVGVVSGAVHRPRPDRDQGTVEGRGDLQVDARVADLRREQVRHVVPVPGGTDRAIDQHGSLSDEFDGSGYEGGEDVTDGRAQQPITDANRGDALSGGDLTEEEHEVTLTAQRAVVDKDVVPVERVQLGTETVTEQEQVDETVRKEVIDEVETDGTAGRRTGRTKNKK
jgi:hypothetical protein